MKKFLLTLLGVALALPAFARDFTYTYEGQTLTYTVIDEAAKTVRTRAQDWEDSPGNNVSGDLIIPSTVKSEGQSYTVTSIGNRGFYGCTGLTSVEIPNSVTSIGGYAFTDCSGLTSVEIPNSVTEIGSDAFSYCSGLTSVTIPNSITKIESFIFLYCTGLTSITIPNSVTEIGGCAFLDCSGLTSVEIPKSVTSIGNGAFSGCSGLTSVEIPKSVTSIGDGAFSDCSGLTSVEIPNSVTTIGDGTFGSCSQLTEIKVADGNPNYSSLDGVLFNKDQTTLLQFPGGKGPNYIIPNTVISFGWRPFRDCVGLKSVVISDNIKDIDEYLFSHCSQLESVKFGRSVATIGYYAFAYCTNLKSIEFGSSILYIDNEAFEQCLNMSEYIVDEDNPHYSSLDGVLFNKDKTTLIQYAKGKQNTEYSIPKSVENICYYAFGNCKTLKCIEIPKSVTNIDDEAFYLCNFEFVYACSDVPPTCDSSVFDGGKTYNQAILYVPVGSMETYKETSPWKYFKTIKEDPNLGIKETESTNVSIEIVDGAIVVKGSGDVSVYNMMGAQVYSGAVGRIELPGGIYLVVTNSLTKKVKI